MNRREFVTLVGGTAARPMMARAQEFGHPRRLAVYMNLPEGDVEAQRGIGLLRQGLAALGWTEGRNLHIDYRWATDEPNSTQAAVAELVRLAPDVILASATEGLAAFQRETRTIPIVFVSVSDPVGQGFVESLARPGGNITGFTAFEFSMGSKWIEMLKEIAPSVRRVAVVFNPKTAPYFELYLHSIESGAATFSVKSIAAPIQDIAEIETAIIALARDANAGLIFPPTATLRSIARRSLRWLHVMQCRRYSPGVNSLPTAPPSLTGSTGSTCTDTLRLTSIASSRAPSRRTCRSSSRPSSSWPSTSRLQSRLALPCRRRC